MTETSSASGSPMNPSTRDQARLVVVGATGMDGGYAFATHSSTRPSEL